MAKTLFYLIGFFGIILMGIGYYSIFIILKFRILAKKYYPEILKKYSKNFKWGFKLVFDEKVFNDSKIEKIRIILKYCTIVTGSLFLIIGILSIILIYFIYHMD